MPIIEGDNYNNILQSKMNVKTDEIWAGLPSPFKKIFDYIRNLGHNDEIDYEFIERLLYLAAQEWKISIPINQFFHRFHWLLEGKWGTEGSHFQHTMKHLESLDSFMERQNKSNDWIDNDTFKTHAKESKEEHKAAWSPSEVWNAT